ncbi:hypothetical protein ALNOE001_13510 [Candidatus Methanobinarius endosymbioticus]|uniref:Uncharacterized protein n=1 Tax=Candidatus Methanobinarius endosymbioticus TaxID=2006182 RepID=A0A366M9R8_9EURY|nr:hypothetical protein ALNOE001_13510 [Candidatus Methanobinarius endosymbioticus]
MKIEKEISEILENNNINPVLSGNPEFLAIIRIYEEGKADKVIKELEVFFKKFKSYSINSSHINPCCSPSFDEIRYKLVI